MCGIVGYVGPREVPSLLVDGLRRLEYRGYDSCGIAVLDNGSPKVMRAAGRIASLEEKLQAARHFAVTARCGIAHTRWATHGRPSEENAHPHRDCTGHIMVAHNGIIENYLELRRRLAARGHSLKTETDTEVLPHLIEEHFHGNLEEAVRAALREVEGVYGVVAISTWDGRKIVAARRGPPLVIGVGQGENFIASDAPALLPYTRDVIFLDDGELAVIRSDSVELIDWAGGQILRRPQNFGWTSEMAEKEGYPHFMVKEIYEQPRVLRDTMLGRIAADGLVRLEDEIALPEVLGAAERLHIVACGTSLHAGLVGKLLVERLAGIPVEVDYASEFRYRDPLLEKNSVVVGISQSGETADTLAAMREAKNKGAYLLSICNVVCSMAARQSDSVLYTRAGPEIGVASTKAFTAQLSVLFLLALQLAKQKGTLPEEEIRRLAELLARIPSQMEQVLQASQTVEALARQFQQFPNCLYLGRGISYPIAMEGALKLKEIAYIHAEGYPAGEMKHGPIALIDGHMPVVVVAPRDAVYKKTMSNIEEVKVRQGIVVAVATAGDREIAERSTCMIAVPETDPLLSPLLTVVPLQLLAYHAGIARGTDVDKPRNLAKSVTVE